MEEVKEDLCPCRETCVLGQAMDSIGGKWKIPILCSLMANGPTRYNTLLKKIRGISNAMLAKSLRELEEDRLIIRKEYLEVPVRVEYEVSERGESLREILLQLIEWQLNT